MATFDAGSAIGHFKLDSSGWVSGANTVKTTNKGIAKSMFAAQAAFSLVSKAISGTISFLKDASRVSNEFSKEMNNVSTLVDTSSFSMQAFKKEILNLDSAVGKPIELVGAAYQTLSAGIQGTEKDIAKFVGQSAKLAKAIRTDATSAVDIITTAYNAYGMTLDEVNDISNIFTKTVFEGKVTGEELSATIGKSIPLFASAGIGLDQLTAGLAAMTKVGVSSAEATTQLNAIVNAFIKPSEAMTAALKEAGVASGSALLETEGLSGALAFLQETTGGNNEKLGELLPNIRAMRGVMALAANGGQEFADILKRMNKEQDVVNEAFLKQQNAFVTLSNEMQKIKIIFGDLINNFLRKLAVNFADAAKEIRVFLTSAEGIKLLDNVAKDLAGTLTVTWEIIKIIGKILKDVVEPIFKDTKSALALLNKEGDQGNIVFDLLAKSLKLGGAFLTIFAKQIGGTIKTVANLVKAIELGAKTISAFVKGNFADAEHFARKTGDAFIKLGTDYVDTWKDIGKTVVSGFNTLTGQLEAGTVKMDGIYKDISDSTKSFFKGSLDEMTQDQKEALEKQITQLQEHQKKKKELNTLGREEERLNMQDHRALVTEATRAFRAQHLEEERQALEKRKAMMKSFGQFTIQSIFQIGNIWGQFYSQEIEKRSQFFKKQLEQTKTTYTIEQAELQKKFDDGLISEEEFTKQSQALKEGQAREEKLLEERKKKELNALKKKQMAVDKAFSIAQVWVNLAQAIMGFWAAYGKIPFAGPVIAGVMTGIATGIAGAQTALISRQQFVPAATGGEVMRPGTFRVNETGGEIRRLNTGDIIIPNDVSEAMGEAAAQVATAAQIEPQMGGQTTNNIEINNPTFDSRDRMDELIDNIIEELGRRKKFAVAS